MKFTQRDFSAILRVGQQLISSSDNPKNVEAARKLIYGLAEFVTEDHIQAVMNIAKIIDFETAVTIVAQLGEEEFDWANDLLCSVAKAGGEMNDDQIQILDTIAETYWEFRPADDDGSFDAFA